MRRRFIPHVWSPARPANYPASFDATPKDDYLYTPKRVLWAVGAQLEQPFRVPMTVLQSYGTDCELVQKKDEHTGDYLLSTFPESIDKVKPRTRQNGSLPLAAIAELEEALLAKAEHGLTPALQKTWDRAQKAKALALHPTTSPEAKNEATTALRTLLVELVKAVI